MGSLLNVKPILAIEAGEVVPVGRVRGRAKAFEEFRKRFEEATTDGPGLGVAIAHAEAEEAVEQLREIVLAQPPAGRGQAREQPGRGRRHARRPRHRRLLLVPGVTHRFVRRCRPGSQAVEAPSRTTHTGAWRRPPDRCHTRTMSRPLTGFAAVDPPDRWTPTRGRFRPERLEAPIDSLTGVGPTLKKRLAKLGLEHVGDLLDHRPRRYERPAPREADRRPVRRRGGPDRGRRARDVAAPRRADGSRSSPRRSPTAAGRSRRPGSTSRG